MEGTKVGEQNVITDSTTSESEIGIFKTVQNRFENFFFKEEIPYGLAIMRICLPIVILFTLIPRWFFARELFSTDGAPAQLGLLFGYANFFPEFSGTLVVAGFTALIFFAICSSIGWYTRFSLIAMLVLYVYFSMMDAISTMTKYNVISCHFLLLLSLSNCGSVFSVDAWRRKKLQTNPEKLPLKFPMWTRRVIQLLMGLIYFGAAITKFHTPTYLSGDQLKFWMATEMNHPHLLGNIIATVPAMLVTMCYVALIWEILFLFIAWKGWSRMVMLTMGITFHSMTAFTLGLYIFPMVSFCGYLSFMGQEDFEWIKKRFGFLFEKISQITQPIQAMFTSLGQRILTIPVHAMAAFPILLLTVIATGVQAEYAMDPYGVRQAAGPYELKPMDQKLVNVLFQPMPKLRESDKVYSFDLGRRMIGGVVLETSKVFKQGERIIVQASLTPPHGDMYLECVLFDDEGNVVDSSGKITQRENFRATFNYYMTCAHKPGKYRFLLRANGSPVEQQFITLEAGPQQECKTPLAN